jgi:ABC-type multidrug transport system ATPase subunit
MLSVTVYWFILFDWEVLSMEIVNFSEVKYEIPVIHRSLLINISLSIKTGETHVITGPSGSGKTTLLHLIGAILFPTAGTVKIFGRESKPEIALALRKRINYLFQTPVFVEHLSVKENFSIFGQ